MFGSPSYTNYITLVTQDELQEVNELRDTDLGYDALSFIENTCFFRMMDVTR